MEKSKMRENLKKRYKLENGQRIMLDALIKMSEVENIEYVLRGYENLDKKLQEIGAKIYIK